ncbi:PREDICTED: DNA-binding protein Rfx5-like, partial [Priapulus caudatus]|uniref:DNA-binding protein Rfx5-like n=1 Tax=Priapulus caudatus TaxID=37621 RepID=A0ABM1FA30_PRICU
MNLIEESKKRILVILEEVNKLSDVEKLLLYLKLPKGTNQHQPQSGCSAGSSRQDQANAITWIRSHLEEDPGVSIPKHEVYDNYKLYCDTHKLKAVSQADFGKIIKSVLPNIKPRRLGNRGNSKYCYAGLRKTIDMKVPSLPPIHIPSSAAAAAERELSVAASTVISEWAAKQLGRSFTSLQHIAVHLISNMYVDDRSMAAFTVLNASGGEEAKASHIAAATTDACKSVTGNRDVAGSGNAQSTTITQADRHKATQMQLQRKLQEG